MKKIFILLGLASLVVVGCMVYLLKTGISLSPAVMIRPSVYSTEDVILESTVQRLFPYFSQYKEWVIVPEFKELENQAEVLKTLILKHHPNIHIEIKAFSDSESPLRVLSRQTIMLSAFVPNDFPISAKCKNMQRLDYVCFKEVSLHKSRRKFKDLTKNYFMMTSYLDTNFLLLIQKRNL